jgi:acetyltransferase-like isoleucine patch superfamily enzyme
VLWPLITGRRIVASLLHSHADLVARFGGFDAALRLLGDGTTRHNPAILTALGATVGAGCMIHSPLLVQHSRESLDGLVIGSGAHIGQDVFIDLTDAVEIGPNVTISMRCTILTHMDVGRSPLGSERFPRKSKPVHLGPGCYVGAGATILAGVTVGACAVVAAGAVVTSDVPEGETVAGIPARHVGRRAHAGAVIDMPSRATQ